MCVHEYVRGGIVFVDAKKLLVLERLRCLKTHWLFDTG